MNTMKEKAQGILEALQDPTLVPQLEQRLAEIKNEEALIERALGVLKGKQREAVLEDVAAPAASQAQELLAAAATKDKGKRKERAFLISEKTGKEVKFRYNFRGTTRLLREELSISKRPLTIDELTNLLAPRFQVRVDKKDKKWKALHLCISNMLLQQVKGAVIRPGFNVYFERFEDNGVMYYDVVGDKI